MRVTKKQLITEIARDQEITFAHAKRIIDQFLWFIEDKVQYGIRVKLEGFGCFEAVTPKPRQGFNPQTKKPMQVVPKRTMRFRASISLRRNLNY